MGREVVVAITNGKLDFGPWEQIPRGSSEMHPFGSESHDLQLYQFPVKHGYASALALPLLDGNRAFGSLSIYVAKPDAFNAEEVELLTKLADDLAYGILALRKNLEQQKVEKAARASEENLDRAQAVAHIGSWHLDLRNDVLTWSAETHRMFGIQPGQPLTLESFLARIHPTDREGVLQAWNAALRDARYDIEHRIIVGKLRRTDCVDQGCPTYTSVVLCA